jgi:PleD family two-component response regulator
MTVPATKVPTSIPEIPSYHYRLSRNPAVTTENVRSLKILVVDDESFVLNLTVRVLNKLGYGQCGDFE